MPRRSAGPPQCGELLRAPAASCGRSSQRGAGPPAGHKEKWPLMNATPFTSELGLCIARYLILKEALGRKYRIERATLTHLDRFLSAQPTHVRLTTQTFAPWSATLAYLKPAVRRNHMRIVRNLCLYRRRSHWTRIKPMVSMGSSKGCAHQRPPRQQRQ